MSSEYVSLPQVIGQNVRRLRGDRTMDELATAGRIAGVRWSSGSIRAIETGTFKPTIETLAALTLAIDRLNGEKLRGKTTLFDLLKTDGQIQLTTEIVSSDESLRRFLSGEPSGSVIDQKQLRKDIATRVTEYAERLNSLNLPDLDIEDFINLEGAPASTTEERLAKRAGIQVEELRMWAHFLWSKTIEEKRDEIAGEGATPQKKGRATRGLITQILDEMNNGNR